MQQVSYQNRHCEHRHTPIILIREENTKRKALMFKSFKNKNHYGFLFIIRRLLNAAGSNENKSSNSN